MSGTFNQQAPYAGVQLSQKRRERNEEVHRVRNFLLALVQGWQVKNHTSDQLRSPCCLKSTAGCCLQPRACSATRPHKKARSARTVLSAIVFLVNRWIRRQVKELHAIGRVFR
jgi:hypothetical protein